MKRFLAISCIFFPIFSFTQTIVSTTPSKKNVVLEEFTGINCGYCPQGHQIAQSIYDKNPSRVVVINIHTGNYANPDVGQPDFRTQWGAAIAGQSGLTGFPSGTVNRHVFSGLGMSVGSTAMGRGNWDITASQVLAENSNLNIGAQATINYQTRLLTVYVEVYYTSNSAVATNKLNIALMQNNTTGPQAGGSNSYNHMHRLIHLLTNQWGADITSTSQGTLYSNTFTYTIPDELNSIPILLDDLELGVFVAQNQQEIITGIKLEPTLTNPVYQNELGFEKITLVEKTLASSISPVVEVKNMGNDVTNFTINYSINNGVTQQYSWEGDLKFGRSTRIQLPESEFILLPTNTLTIEFSQDDEVSSNNTISKTFYKSPVTTKKTVNFKLETDKYGDEVSWSIKDLLGNTIQSGGPYSQSVQTINHTFTMSDGDYVIEVNDIYGDGLFDGSTTGRLKIWTDDTELFLVTGNYGKVAIGYFRITSPAQITVIPENGNEATFPDKPIMVESTKRLFLSNWELITNSNLSQLITLKKDNSTGQDISFSSTIDEDGKTISITPNSQFDFSTTYFITLNGTIYDEDGLVTTYTPLTFTTLSNGAPEVEFPVANNQTDVFIDLTFDIHFNQPLMLTDGAELTNDNVATVTYLRKGSQTGESVTSTITISSDKKVITINPVSNLEPQQVYYLGVGSNLKGVYNNPITEQGVSFTTGTSLNINYEFGTKLNVYPNPSDGQFIIELPDMQNQNIQVDIYSTSGALLHSMKYTNLDSKIDVDIRNLTKGTYIARISSISGIIGKSILIVK